MDSQLNKGSLFWCNLPYENKESHNIDKVFPQQSLQSDSIDSIFSNQKFLIVENNVLNQKVIGGLLRKYNINFDVAENGEVAVSLFQENKYDLILMDCEMPVMDGFEAILKIRELSYNFV